jgi:hypothetical protein
MARTVSAKIDDKQLEYLEDAVDRGEYGTISEAIRTELPCAGQQTPDTAARRTIARFRDSVTLLGMLWLTLTLLYPVGIRGIAIPIFGVAIALHGLEKLLERVEPRATDWARGLVGVDQ